MEKLYFKHFIWKNHSLNWNIFLKKTIIYLHSLDYVKNVETRRRERQHNERGKHVGHKHAQINSTQVSPVLIRSPYLPILKSLMLRVT